MTEQIQVEPESPNARVRIRCGGDLRVEGWENALIEVDGQGSQPVVDVGPEQIEIEAEFSLVVRLPQTSELVEIAAGGRVEVSNLRGGVELAQASGDLQVEDVGSVKIGSAVGRVNLTNIADEVQVRKRAQGDVTAQNIGGGISIAAVAGRLTLQNVSAVHVERAHADIDVLNAGGNVVVGRAHGTVDLINVDGEVSLFKALGDASLRGVQGNIACDQINGRLHLADVAEVTIRRVMGDLAAEGIRGALACQKANGRGTLREVDGSISLGGVGGDLVVEGCGGSFSANCGGGAALSGINGSVSVKAGGDVRCRLAENTGASIKAVCGGSLTVEGGPTLVARGPGVHTFSVGDSKNSYVLVAGGGVHLESGAELEGLGEDAGARGARGAARAQRRIARSLGRTFRRKLRATGKRAAEGDWGDARSWSFSFDTDEPASGTATRDEQLLSDFDDIDVDVDLEIDIESELDDEPVSDEERLTVFRMLAEGKITAAEAEQLLDALASRASEL